MNKASTPSELATSANVAAYAETTDKWLFVHDLIEEHGFPATDSNIEKLERVLEADLADLEAEHQRTPDIWDAQDAQERY